MKTILVLTDFTKHAEQAAHLALIIAGKLDAEVLLYHAFYVYVGTAVPMEGGVFPYYDDVAALEKESTRRLNVLEEKLIKKSKLSGRSTPPIKILNEPGTVSQHIDKLLKDHPVEMIVMGDKSKGGFMDRVFLGSETEAVINKVRCPVLLVPEREPIKPLKKIGFATDFRTAELASMHYVINLAKIFDAEVVCIHVFEKHDKNQEEAGIRFYQQLEAETKYPKMTYRVLLGEKVVNELEQFAVRGDIDILALAQKDHGFFQKIFRVSTVKEVLSYHNVPLMILPGNPK